MWVSPFYFCVEVFFQTERGERRRLHSLFESSREGEREHYPREFERPEGTAAAAGSPRSLSRSESEGLKLRSREEEEDDDDEKRRQKQETLDERNNARKKRLKNEQSGEAMGLKSRSVIQ
uniref:Uncharacterized protein n=1 Tax=Nelumbo nucifera TaxID=4432 RepID=A0A822ZC12_NELNU|nr:TPA_asm: hypothetical protein HUJ06_014889 [Nelumbo nucifera]